MTSSLGRSGVGHGHVWLAHPVTVPADARRSDHPVGLRSGTGRQVDRSIASARPSGSATLTHSAEWSWNPITFGIRSTNSMQSPRSVVGAEREAVVGEAEPQTDRRVPPVRTGDLGVVPRCRAWSRLAGDRTWRPANRRRSPSPRRRLPTPSATNMGFQRMSSRYGKNCSLTTTSSMICRSLGPRTLRIRRAADAARPRRACPMRPRRSRS